MVETIVDNETIAAGGGSSNDNGLTKPADVDEIGLVIRGDSNTTDLTVGVDGVELAWNATPHVDANFTPTAPANVDATGDANNAIAVQVSGLRGFEHVFLSFTNNATSDTTITVETLNQ